MTATVFGEPLLEFAQRQRHIDPRFGIASYGPVDRGSDDAPRDLNVGLVGPPSALANARDWMKECARGVAAKSNNSYPNLWQAFPGFSHETGFGASLVFTDRLQRSLRARDLTPLRPDQGDVAVRTAVDLYLTEIEALAQAAQPRVIVCVIPLQLLQSGEADEGDEDEEAEHGGPRQQSLAGRFHDLLKAEAMRFRVPLQLMRPGTYNPQLAKGTLQRAPLQDEATRAWNFLTALYYKAGGTPWRLVRDDAALESCFVGVSFYWRDDDTLATSVAQVFDERGDGVVVRGGPATRSTDDKQLHLREDDAYELLSNALKAFRAEHKHLPARIVVHKTTPFDQAECDGMLRAVDDEKVESGELIWVSEGSGVRLFRSGQQPPLRGTFLELESEYGLLYTRGAVEYYGTYPGMYVPRPVALRPATRERPLGELAAEVLALSKMNWNSTQFDGHLPVSIRTARDVSDIIRRLDEDAPVEPRYAFYM
jgi:hypothetical protein